MRPILLLAAMPLLWVAACSGDRSSSQRQSAAAPRPTVDPGAHAKSLDAGVGEANPTVGDASASATGADGAATAADGAATVGERAVSRPRIGSIGRVTWIYPRPSRKSEPIGSIRPGTAVTLRATEPLQGEGCPRWYEVEPRGFVCFDGKATLDLDKEPFKALASLVPDRTSAFPYRYAYSTGAPMYGRVPDADQQARIERGYRRLDKIPRHHKPRSGHEELATDDTIAGADPNPYFASSGEFPRMPGQRAGTLRWEIPEGAMLSYRSAIDVGGRVFLVSPDLSLVSADRVRPFRPSSFRGLELTAETPLPIGWIRKEAKAKYRKADDGSFAPTGDHWPVRTWVGLTGQKVEKGGTTWLETRDQGLFIKASDVSVVDLPGQLPFSVAPDEKWIDASIDKGTLTLYVGSKPVFSTLMSPGAGGVPPATAKTNEELVKGSHTPLGIYRINYKVRETTMTPEKTPFPEKSWIADVPYTLYFRMPFAIHGAYWHEDFGQPKSGGCINLSPIDARYVFDWVEPKIPDEWSGVSGAPATGLGTKVFIHR
ncbi:MAG: L,D-transpeptidase [Deltaproteobacteria bacterium]|nr:L,D-transpeptidase [Deltaproteobacteria bacterium]